MFKRLLIANRGEIACRIMRTAHRLGIETVAIYSEADANSLHVQQADFAVCIGEAPAIQSYLNIDTIIQAAINIQADAIHPGYGFLSENVAFATGCKKAGIVFVGPSVKAMDAMASKQRAKQILEKTNVPLTPGYHGQDQTDATLLQQAKLIGFPVLLKAAQGGGGKGMREVQNEQAFDLALASARREALACFADDTMLIEKLVQNPRHVEMQIMADHHGQVVHLFERDCSIQRRHQKIIEEAPAPNLSDTLRQQLAQAAIEVAKTIAYRGAGTVEFLVADASQFYFMEMNTRLQVEHPVTEMITGLDLVEWQLRIAANEPLPLTQEEITHQGHAIECRIYAEDPRHNLPSTGVLTFLQEPQGDGIRVDSGVSEDRIISPYYDAMIAKLIAWGETREKALHRMQLALRHYHVGGVKTNLLFLHAMLNQPAFVTAQLSTDFLSKHPMTLPTVSDSVDMTTDIPFILAASIDYLSLLTQQKDPLYQDTFAWQMPIDTQPSTTRTWSMYYQLEQDIRCLVMTPHRLQAQTHWSIEIKIEHSPTRTYQLAGHIDHTKRQLHLQINHQQMILYFTQTEDQTTLYFPYEPLTITRHTSMTSHSQAQHKGQLTAPMPATIVALLKQKGDHIKAGDGLVVLEAMKMEHTVHAPQDGLLSDIFYDVGAQVPEGAELVAVHPLEENPS